ncbi:hypothetical protein ACFX2I_041375 [Malus domestica]
MDRAGSVTREVERSNPKLAVVLEPVGERKEPDSGGVRLGIAGEVESRTACGNEGGCRAVMAVENQW